MFYNIRCDHNGLKACRGKTRDRTRKRSSFNFI